MSAQQKAVFKRCRQKKDKAAGTSRPRSAKKTMVYVLEGKNATAVTAVEGRAPGGRELFGDAHLDALAFASRAPVGKSEVGHYTLAAEGEGSPAKRLGLLRAGHAFANAYLDDDQGYMLVVHKDQHVHIIPELYNSAGRAFYVDDDLYMRMKLLEFTREFEANDQTPNPASPRRTFDPKAQRAHAARIAKGIVLGETTLEALVASGKITPARKDKETGKMTSFDYTDDRGRVLRIGVSTVEGHVAELRKKRELAEAKAKAVALGELQSSAKKMMSQGVGGMFEELEQVAQGDPTPVQAPRGRSK